MNILVTGGLGFIGSNLVNLLSVNNNVIVIDNKSFGFEDNLSSTVQVIECNICDNIGAYFENIDVVFHLAGISSLLSCESDSKLCYDNNVMGTINVLDNCIKYNIKKLIFASTGAVYENNNTYPLTENLIVSPHLNYSLSKKICEDIIISYATKHKLKYNIFRFFNVYGMRQDYRRKDIPLIPYIITNLLNNKQLTLFSNGNQRRDYVFINDVINLLNIALNTDNNGIYNVSSGDTFSVNEIYQYINDIIGTNICPTFKPYNDNWDTTKIDSNLLKKEINKYTQASNKITTLSFGWIPKISIQDGLKQTIKYYETKKN